MVADVNVVDRVARDRITTELGATLFVDAGAGSGKTSALVDRVVALVTDLGVPLESVAAITFTEKAAGELRDRIRTRLERRSEQDPDPKVRVACAAAVDQLDSAAIGTLHAFARRILSRHAIGAGLPPRIEVLDEISSGVAFEHRWTTLRDRLLDDDGLARTLQLLMATGVRIGAIRHLAATFDDNWDLVAELIPDTWPEPPSVIPLARSALDTLAAACRERETCTDQTDALYVRLGVLQDHVVSLCALDDELELLEALDVEGDAKQAFQLGGGGKAKAWGCPGKEVRDRVKEAIVGLTEVRRTIGEACVRRLAVRLRTATVAAADDRRRAGQLEFHGTCVLLRDPVRAMTATLSLDEWMQVLDREYLGSFVADGGASVKFAVGDTGAHLSERLSQAAGERDLVVLTADAATVKVHMVDQLFFCLAGQVPWGQLARVKLFALAAAEGYQADPESTGPVNQIVAEANDLDPVFVLGELRRRVTQTVFKDASLVKDFRVAMTQLCLAELAGGPEGVTTSRVIIEWQGTSR